MGIADLFRDRDWKYALARYGRRAQDPRTKGRVALPPRAVAEALAVSKAEEDSIEMLGLFRLRDGRAMTVRVVCGVVGEESYEEGAAEVFPTVLDALHQGLTGREHDLLGLGA